MWMLLLLASVAPPVADPLPPGAIARLGSTRWATVDGEGGLAVSPEGKWVATVDGGVVVVLDARTGERVRSLSPGGELPLRNVLAWFRQPNRLLVRTDEEVLLLDPDGERPPVAFLSSHQGCLVGKGTHLFLGHTDGGCNVVDLKTRKTLFTGRTRQLSRRDASLAAGHPSLPQVAIPLPNRGFAVLDALSGKTLWETIGHTPRGFGRYGPPIRLAYDPTGKWLASAGPDGTVRLWHAADGKPGPVFDLGQPQCLDLAWGPNGLLAVAYANGFVQVYRNGKRLSRFGTPCTAPTARVAFSPDGERLYHRLGERTRILCWDLKTGTLISPRHPSTGAAERLRWLDGRRLVTTDRDREIGEWDTHKSKIERTEILHFPIVHASETGCQVLTFSRSNTTLHWGDRLGRTPERSLPLPAETAPVEAAILSEDSKTLLTASWTRKPPFSLELRCWEAATGHERWRKTVANASLAGSIELRLGTAGKLNAIVRNPLAPVWIQMDVVDGKVLERQGITTRGFCLAFSSQDRWRLFANQQGRDWELSLRDQSLGMNVHAARTEMDQVVEALFSPEDRWWAIVGRDGDAHTVRVWERRTGRIYRTFATPGSARAARFCPDGRRIASADVRGSIVLWDLTGRMRGPDGELTSWSPTPADLETGWKQLAALDPRTAYKAVWLLASAPSQSRPFLARRLAPAAPLAPERLAELIDRLDSEDFATRESAEKELEAHGSAVVSQALQIGPALSLEARRRIERVAARLATSAESLRNDRAVFALEQMGEPGRALLYRLAEGVPEAEITQLARAALKRQKSGGTARRDVSAP